MNQCLILQTKHKTSISIFLKFLALTMTILILVYDHTARANMGKIGIGRITHTELMESFHHHHHLKYKTMWPYTPEENDFISKNAKS